MKLRLLAAAIGLAFAASAQAVYIPPSGEQLYFQFSAREQISETNSIIAPSGAEEGNWGVFTVSNIAAAVGSDPTTTSPLSPPIWNDGDGGAQITGIFYGTTNLASCPAGVPLCSAPGGYLDMYWDTGTTAQLSTATPDQRTADGQFTNFTDGTFLVRLVFASGIAPSDGGVAIVGDAVPATDGFNGHAASYMNVDTSVVGAWTSLMDGNAFSTAFGARDVYLRNNYDGPLASWNGDVESDIFGAESSDPFRNLTTVPEPATLLLMGAGALGLGFGTRRRRQA
jgi:hypothetical protein